MTICCESALSARFKLAQPHLLGPDFRGDIMSEWKIAAIFTAALLLLSTSQSLATECSTADIVVYGGTPAGIAAAIQAGRMKKKVILLEPTKHIGGMLSSGLTKTDASPRLGVYSGIAQEFLGRAVKRYNLSDNIRVYFESKWAENTFENLLRSVNVKTVFGQRVLRVVKTKYIKRVLMTSGRNFCGTTFIDASYEGDLMAKAGVKTILGRESRAAYGEKDAGAQSLEKPELGDGTIATVDAYVVPQSPSSGLIPGVIAYKQKPVGSADTNLMAFNYRLCVTDSSSNRVPFGQPSDYDPFLYEGAARFIQELARQGRTVSKRFFIGNGETVAGKYDVNSTPWFSTDVMHLGAAYVNGTESQREKIRKSIRSYTMGFLWFGQTDPRVPKAVRDETSRFGYCADEFKDNENFPYQLYVRQSRRLLGQYVITENDILARTKFSDSIGLGFYAMDQHGMLRTVQNGVIVDDTRPSVLPKGPYEIPYRAMLPKSDQIKNLIVPVALSASHVAYTSIRVEPTYMVLGQAAGAAAALAPKGDVGGVDVKALQNDLKAAGQVLHWND
jgi:hypothetical protein